MRKRKLLWAMSAVAASAASAERSGRLVRVAYGACDGPEEEAFLQGDAGTSGACRAWCEESPKCRACIYARRTGTCSLFDAPCRPVPAPLDGVMFVREDSL
jgi:hypothetical protein